MENRKRKREHEDFAPRIKYHVEQLGRSFERILKEESRGELLNVVRKKLKLDDKTKLELVQLRDERLFDLEDDDDFEAFKAAASEYSSLDVRVSFSPGLASVSASSQNPEPLKDPQKARREGRKSATQQAGRDETMESPSYEDRSQEASPGNLADQSPKRQKGQSKGKDAMPSAEDHRGEKEAPKKTGKTNRDAETISTQQAEATPLVEKTKVKRAKKRSVDVSDRQGSKPKELAEGPEDSIPNTFISGAQSWLTVRSDKFKPFAGQYVFPARASPPTQETRPLSPASLIKSTLRRISQNPATPEEITANYEIIQHEEGAMTKKKTSVPSKKGRSRESRVPGESGDTIHPLPSVGVQPALLASSYTSQEETRTSQSVAPASSTAVSSPVAAATSVPIPASTSLSRTLVSSKPPKKFVSPCPICLGQPFHLQHLCPIIQSGSTGIQKRIDELEQQGGRDDLVDNLRGWLTKSSKKAVDQPKTKDVDSGHQATADNNLPRKEAHPPHVPISIERKTRIGKVSHVLVDSRSEGSESTESSTSQSGSGSQSESESSYSSSLGEKNGPRAGKPNVNLEDVDLEALMRGPSHKSLVDLIDDDKESDDSETSTSLLEEEEEERDEYSRSRKRRRVMRSSSSQSPVADNDQESETGPDHEDPSAINKVGPIVAVGTNTIEGSQDNASGVLLGQFEDENVGLSPVDEPDLHRANPASIVNTEVESTAARVDATFSGRPKTPPVALHELRPAATSTPLSNRPFTHPPRSPLTQQMKDRSGNLPLNSSDDEIELVVPAPPPPADERSASPPATEVPKRGRGRRRGTSQTRAASRPASRTRSSSIGAASASNKPPSSSDAAPKRRGRPPLSEAVKAERKAIREAEKEARAAQKRAATAEKKGAVNSTAERDSTAGEDIVDNSGLGTSVAAAGSPPPPSSQVPNTTLTFPSSSPAADRLISSNAAKGGVSRLGGAASPINADGIKSPGDVSIATSLSRKHDEEDVEEIVGSSQKMPAAAAAEESDAAPRQQQEHPPPPPARRRSPLFLPGASQLTQTQTVAPPRRYTPSSSSETERSDEEEEETLAAPSSAPIPSSQSTFPVLSQLSFDRFRSSFLLPKRSKPEDTGTGKKKKMVKEQEVLEEESESDDDDESSSDEARPPSHIPKGWVAGSAGVVKKRKSRGLFNAL